MRQLIDKQYTSQKLHWTNKLTNEALTCGFPFDHHIVDKEIYEMRNLEYKIPLDLASKLIALSNSSENNLFTILLTGVKILLYKYTNNNDITVFSPNINHKENKNYINLVLPLYDIVSDNNSFKELLINVKKTIVAAHKDKNFSIETMLKDLDIQSEQTINSTFQTLVLLENIHDSTNLSSINFNIVFSFKRMDNSININVKYNTLAYDKNSVNKIVKHLIVLFQEVLNNKEILLSEIEILSETERKQLLFDKTGDSAKWLSDGNTEFLDKDLYSLINATEESKTHKVSSAQKRMFTLNQLGKEDITYNIPCVWIIDGEIDKLRIEQAFKKLVERHEAFRTSFEFEGKDIVQKIHKKVEFKMDYMEASTSQEDIIEEISEDFIKPFDLSKAPLLRAKLVKLKEEKYVLMIDMHHIISDGISIGIIINEIARLYMGQELSVQYKDFVDFQTEQSNSDAMISYEQYWLNIFNGEIPILNMKTDYPRPISQNFEGDCIIFNIGKDLVRGVKRIGDSNQATLFMTLLAAYNILLSKYSGQDDIVIGTPTAGRPYVELDEIVGMFVNTLALRNHPRGDKSFSDFLKDVKENSIYAFENQGYQFEQLVEKLNIKRDLSRNPLFDTMFVLEKLDINDINIDDLKIRHYQFKNKTSKFDFTLMASEIGEEIVFKLEYCTKLFRKDTMERFADYFVNILKVISENSEIMISDIDMISESEKKKILIDFNNTKVEYPQNKAIHEMFEEQAKETPNNIAVVYKNKSISYKELNEKANKVARMLRQKGVDEDIVVGIMVDRSIEMVIGILAILKAGGAYIPIDSNYPKERIEYLLSNSSASILLTNNKIKEDFKLEQVDVVNIVNVVENSAYSSENQNLTYNPDRLMYVLYTSGSTGQPKGVMVKYCSFVNLLNWFTNEFDITEKDNVLLIASVGFDLAQKNLYAPLIRGGKLILFRNGIIDYKEFADIIEDEGITIVNCTPSAFNPLINLSENVEYRKLRTLSRVFLGGEPINLKVLEPWVKSPNYNGEIINTYGPTECTDIATFYRIKTDEICELKSVPIGKPIYNTRLYVLNQDKKLVPIGSQGELYIGGSGVSRGYYNAPNLTKERFINCKYIPEPILYRTGDLVRMLSDGNIEFLGRIDYQVKIRGFRIELEEIESCLLENENINEAIVIDRQDKQGNKYLCAYLVSDKNMTVSELRSDLKEVLPEYMIPPYFIQLEKMPLTPNGKIDRKSLPEPSGEVNTGVEYIAPENEMELKLANIWSEILDIEKIGIDDNFFSLGGHSLKAINMVALIHKYFNIEIPVSKVFTLPTIKQLEKYIKKSKESIFAAITPSAEKEVYNSSAAQQRMFIMNQFGKEETNYNITSVMTIEGDLKRDKIEEVVRNLVERHEAFRTSFEVNNEEVVQRIHEEVDIQVEYMDILEYDENTVKKIVRNFISPFDLSKAPLLRVKMVKLNKEKHILMFDVHHIVSDGTSMNIIKKEFGKLYKGESLEELSIQYKDYSEWENQLLNSDIMKKYEKYWMSVFSGEIPTLNLKTDYHRPATQSFEGKNVEFRIDRELTNKIKKVGNEVGATLYMTLLAIYTILLAQYSGQEDIIIGSPITGRNHANLNNIVGMFVNTLAMRNYPKESKTFIQFLKEVKNNALDAYENQDYQFDDLVKKLGIKRDLSRNPLFDAMLVQQNTGIEEINIDGLKFTDYKFENNVSVFDLTLYSVEIGEEIDLNLVYCSRLFKHKTIDEFTKNFIKVANMVVENTEMKIQYINF